MFSGILTSEGSQTAVSEHKITVPEDMDSENAFDDILSSYTSSYRLISSETTNMGSLYELKFDLGYNYMPFIAPPLTANATSPVKRIQYKIC
ncbi:MAG: hypothetical protein ACI4J5_08070 [Oscillospiraceae bacterium]